MTGFDYTVVAILLVSLLLGLWRGLVHEILSLLGWPLAFLVSRSFAGSIESQLPVSQAEIRVALAYVLVFVAVLIVWSLVVWAFTRMVKATGLSVLDSMLGGMFGLLRGVLIILILVWLGGMSGFPEQAFWRDAITSSWAEDAALLSKQVLPDNIAQRIHYRNKN